MLAAGAAGAVALGAVVLDAVVLTDLAAPASLALALVLVDAVRLAEAIATSPDAALAELLLLPRAGAIEGRKATGKPASRPVAAPFTALPLGGRHRCHGGEQPENEVEPAG